MHSRRFGSLAAAVAVIATCSAAAIAPATATTARVLLVGSFAGMAGDYPTIQAAVAAARPGDWVLIGPGDYKTTTSMAPHGASDTPAGVLVTTPNLHIRGMDRNAVVVDGTRPGSPRCSPAAKDQNFGPAGSDGKRGLNGILVWRADNVSVDNLTVCNFLHGAGNTGNEIWWNGGNENDTIGGWGFSGTYLNATTSYYADEMTAAQYGIFSSNWSGGTWDETYASNFNDSGYYIGACQRACDQTVNRAWAQYNALGYSGSNSGGRLIVENSEFDHNEDGFDTNSQNGDNPPPQDGACPGTSVSPITHTHSCWVFIHNRVHDNNNPNVPSAGSAAAGPVGTGLSVSGGRNDTIVDNQFWNNGAWGTILVPYPDSGPPCTGGTNLPSLCLYDQSGNTIADNTYTHNGFFGNPTNGDIAMASLEFGPGDCVSGNHSASGGAVSVSSVLLLSECGLPLAVPDLNVPFIDEAACDSESISIGPITGSRACLPGSSYPRRTTVTMHPLPAGLPTMPNPCAGVPATRWCPAGRPAH